MSRVLAWDLESQVLGLGSRVKDLGSGISVSGELDLSGLRVRGLGLRVEV